MIAAQSVQFSRPPTFDPFEVDRLDDAELDELPFGVICVDPEGTILRYNAAEARLARLDRTTVIGRRFFGEVAPCTATPDFLGRFERLVSRETPEAVVRFDFLFDFKFGAQEVRVEMLRAPGAERFYVLVNRQTFHPPRAGLDPGFPAPRQSDLSPPEDEVGVLRDLREQRTVQAPLLLFEALLRTCDRVAPETWEIFCREWGLQWGRRTVVDLETECLESTGESLRARPMTEVAERMAELAREQGWGDLRIDLSSAADGGIRVHLVNSALAAASRHREGGRRCHLVAGLLTGLFSHVAGRRLHVEEVRCEGQGHPSCELLVVGATRASRVADMARQRRDTQEILRSLETRDGG